MKRTISMEKIITWFKNFGSDLLLMVVIPFLALVKSICNFADLFVNNQSLTNFIKLLNDLEKKLSDWNGNKE